MSSEPFNKSYISVRPDIQSMVPSHAKTVLDIGCSNGALGADLRKNKNVTVVGLEADLEMGHEASKVLNKVHVGDAISLLEERVLVNEQFDVVIMADILEHLVDPWCLLKLASRHINPGGVALVSIPNIRHFTTIYSLVVRGYWPYRDRGIHDKTHLRFFTKKNIEELFAFADMKVDKLSANYRIIEKPHSLNKFAKYLALPGLKGFLSFQYLIVASRN